MRTYDVSFTIRVSMRDDLPRHGGMSGDESEAKEEAERRLRLHFAGADGLTVETTTEEVK